MASCPEKSKTTCRKHPCKRQGQPSSGLCMNCFSNIVTAFEMTLGSTPAGVGLMEVAKSFVLLVEKQPSIEISDMVNQVALQHFPPNCKSLSAKNKKTTVTRSRQTGSKTHTRTNRSKRRTHTPFNIRLQMLVKSVAENGRNISALEDSIAGKRLQLQTLQSLLGDLAGVKLARFLVEEEEILDDLTNRILDLRKEDNRIKVSITRMVEEQLAKKGINNEKTPEEKKKKRGKRGGKKLKKKTHASEELKEQEICQNT